MVSRRSYRRVPGMPCEIAPVWARLWVRGGARPVPGPLGTTTTRREGEGANRTMMYASSDKTESLTWYLYQRKR